jgi:hypothetical protein
VSLAESSFEAATRSPERSQAHCLGRLLAGARDTAFAREHHLDPGTTVQEFRRRVPARDYEALRPYFERVLAGERRVLTREPARRFVSTSGTTAAPKLLPVTRTFRGELARLGAIWLERALHDHPRLLDDSLLALVGADREGATDRGAPVGCASGLACRDAPRLLRERFAVPARLHAIADDDTRYRLVAQIAATRRISCIATPNPTTLLRLAETIAEEADAILRSPERRPHARDLERKIAADGTLLPRHLWPELRLIGCWLGGSVGLHAKRLAPLYGAGVPIRDLGYRASEGTFTIPWSDATAAGVPALESTFFEFAPESCEDLAAAPTRLVHELVDGGRYRVLVTTSAGLWRYDLGDLVEVRGFRRRAPLLAFLRKGDDFSSICGEKLHVNHVVAAWSAAQRERPLPVRQLRLIPDVGRARYDVLLEFDGATPPDERLRDWVARFDAALARDDVEYASRRRSRRLHAPTLHVMAGGWSREVQREDVRHGRRDAQYKWRLLTAEWDRTSTRRVLHSLAPDAPDVPQRILPIQGRKRPTRCA